MPGSLSMDSALVGNTGNSIGISTAGYRSSKYNHQEWDKTNYDRFFQSLQDREFSENSRFDSKATINEIDAKTKSSQEDNTKRLAERLKDLTFWKSELKNTIADMIEETDVLVSEKRRLERALRNTELPLLISTDNLNCRQRRQLTDLVQDDVEISLLKEIEIINTVQDLQRRTIREAEAQISRNRDRKHELEADWSDKWEAEKLDSFAGSLRNENTCKQFFPGSATFQAIQSTPESWAQFTHDNIARAEQERMASIKFRDLNDNILKDTSRDMRAQADTVDSNFNIRINEEEDAKYKLEENLRKVILEIREEEKNIQNLKQAIKDKEDPLKVAHTRLHTRANRPNVELCRDPVQYGLVNEVGEINTSIDNLAAKLEIAETALNNLQDNQMDLEKDISVRKNTLFIEREKCLKVREKYPSTLKLQGYDE